MKTRETKENSYFYVLSLALILMASQAVLGGDLKITPLGDFEPSGQAGGPFSPSFKEYQLTNNGSNSIYWGAEKTVEWLDLDPGWGPLDPCESTIVTVSLTSEANSLGGGVHTDTITFIDITNNEEQTREAILTISAIPGMLEITPLENFEPTGEIGGPFTPSSKDYQLTNSGGSLIYWGATKTVDWLDLDFDFGLLDPCESTIVNVSLNLIAESLGEGVHIDTLTFTDLTNAQEQTRGVTLTINVPPAWISPRSFDVNIIEGLSLTEILTIGNNTATDLNFMIRTRQVGTSESSGETTVVTSTEKKGRISSVPEGKDFTVAGEAPYKPGELIVRFASNADGRLPSMAERSQILNLVGGGTIKYDFKIVPGLSVVKLPSWTTVEEALLAFNEVEGILYAQPNYEMEVLSTFPNDPRFNELWGMHNTGQTGGTFDADIDATEAWDITTGSSDIIVAVIDTGVDYTHQDIAANMWVNEAELNGSPGVDDDGNGYVDDIYGYDFCNNDGDPMDDHYHGTHCAGTIGAVGNNGEGVAGVCWNVKIMALKFLNSGGSGWTDDAIKCVEYSTLMGANLSSNSWGGGGYNQGLKDAIDAAGAAGMLFVAAAGNDGVNNDMSSHYPSSYNCVSLIAVMATDSDDRRSAHGGWASNYGPQSVDIGAPGSSILSCEPGNRYGIHSGTSMATPHVAGACALLWSTNSVMSNNEVKDILLRTVDKTLTGLCVSEGRLNLYKAVLETKAPWIKIEPEAGTIGPGESNDISVTFDALEMMPGTYQAEILIISNQLVSPRIIPVTMTVNPDDLQVVPAEGFESTGTEGGPFEPQCTVYTLTNNGAELVNWTTFETENWLQVLPYEGVLGPNETMDVNVCISPEANLLDPNIYTTTLMFQNSISGSIKPRLFTLIVKPPDCFTEFFEAGDDLANLMLAFSPDGSNAYYEACRDKINRFPTDPNGGTYVPLGDDDFAEIILSEANVLFYGRSYDRFYIGSNGYITFEDGDTQYSPSLENHFNRPRISGLFADLTPPDKQCISYKQLDDKMVVTFENVPLFGDKTATNSFQIEMFFTDGTIRITWLHTTTTSSVVGLSRGRGLPPAFFEQSNLNSYPVCWPLGDFDRDYSVGMTDLSILVSKWLDTDCNMPYWCGRTDIDVSRMVDFVDFAIFSQNWLTTKDWLQPVSHWKFDEGSGNIAYDSAGTNDGTIYGATWTTGQFDGALSFDDVDDYIEVSDDPSLRFTQYDSFSVSFWAKPSTEGYVFSKLQAYSQSGLFGYALRWQSNYSNFQFMTQKSGTANVFVDTTDNSATAGSWYHITAVYDKKDMKIYLNAELKGINFFSYDTGSTSPDNNLTIGVRLYDTTLEQYFGGIIDDVIAFDRALSDEEIWYIYRTGIGNKASAPHPADGTIDVDPNVVLGWSPGKDATSHDVYLGTDYNDVDDATPDSNEYKGNYQDNSYGPCGLELDTTYYWRIDEVGELTTHKGDIWSLTTWAEFTPDCVSWWKFDEGTGTIAYDSAGTNDGTIYGATWTTGKINGALSFDDVDDYVMVSDDTSLRFTQYDSFSLSFWAKPSTGGYVFSKLQAYSQSGLFGYALRWLGPPKFQFMTQKSGAGNVFVDTTDNSAPAGSWYYVTAVYDNKDMKIYLNGELKGTAFFGHDTGSTTPDNDFTIGVRLYDTTLEQYFGGIIDEVILYDRAISAEEIQQLYQSMYLTVP